MSFEDYIDSNFRGYVDEISDEEKIELKVIYDKLLTRQTEMKIFLESDLNSKKTFEGIKKYDDLSKEITLLSAELSKKMNIVKRNLGIDEIEDISRRSM